VRRKVALFGEHGKGPGLYGAGPHRELIGRPLSALTVAPAGAESATFATPDALGAVDTKGDFLPIQVAGRLTGGGADRGQPLAIALNGTIAAVGWGARLAGDPKPVFSFLVPPARLRDGANTAQVFAIEDAGGGVRLVPLGQAG
jgi:hypothetical protein